MTVESSIDEYRPVMIATSPLQRMLPLESIGQQLVERALWIDLRTIIEYRWALVCDDERSTGGLGLFDILYDRD